MKKQEQMLFLLLLLLQRRSGRNQLHHTVSDIFENNTRLWIWMKLFSYHRMASSSPGVFSTAISMVMYDLESAYIWDNGKSLGGKRWRSYLTKSAFIFHCFMLMYDRQMSWSVPPCSPEAPVQTHSVSGFRKRTSVSLSCRSTLINL